MLKDIWSLPRQCTNQSSGVLAAREALWILGKLLYHLIFPYLCVDLSLSEQIEHLSATAHLALALYILAGKDFILTNLYIDLMIMIKNVIFSIAKAKVDDPDGEFWIILLGTDHLKELFGILKTMVGTDANSDILQLVSRLSGTMEVSNILAKYPKWDNSPCHLKLPAISRESNESIPDSADHIKPASWRGNVHIKDISLQTSWSHGCHQVEQACNFVKPVLVKLDENPQTDILSPSGTMLFNIPLAEDDIDKSLELPRPSPAIIHPSNNDAEACVEVEDALGELESTEAATTTLQKQKVDAHILVNGKLKAKARALVEFSKYRKQVGSTDRLWRVQDIERHIQNKNIGSYSSEFLPPPADDADILLVSDSIASILSCDKKIWLCIGEVNGLNLMESQFHI